MCCKNTHTLDTCWSVYSYVFVGQQVVHGAEHQQVPEEALMTQGVEGGWVVAAEVWLAMGHYGSSQAQSWCTRGGNSLGSTWALGLSRLWSTPLIRPSDSIIRLQQWPWAMWREVNSERFLKHDRNRSGSQKERDREKETEGAKQAPGQVLRKRMRDSKWGKKQPILEQKRGTMNLVDPLGFMHNQTPNFSVSYFHTFCNNLRQ